jgi:hypothetical protein
LVPAINANAIAPSTAVRMADITSLLLMITA